MSKTLLTLTLVLGAALSACGSEPTTPPTTMPPGNTGDRLAAILAAPGPATTCVPAHDIPAPVITQTADPKAACPGSDVKCGNGFPLIWCTVDGNNAIVQCEGGSWVVKIKACP